MLEMVRREGHGALASPQSGALRLLSRVWASGVDILANEALVELDEVTRKSKVPAVAPLWTFPHPSQSGVGHAFYVGVFDKLFEILGDAAPASFNLPMPEKPKYEGEKMSGIPRANNSTMLMHAVRHWPWAVECMLSSKTYEATELHSALTQLTTWDEPPRAGKRTWPCVDEAWVAEYQRLIVLLLSPPHSLLPRNWNSPTAMRWYYDTHGKDPNLDNAPTSGWNVTSTIDDDGIELCVATNPNEDWTKDASKLNAAIDLDNPRVEEGPPKCGATEVVVKDEEEDAELHVHVHGPRAQSMDLERTDSVTECGSPHAEEAAAEAVEAVEAVEAEEAAEAATARSRARLVRLLRLPLVVGWWWRLAQWRRDRGAPRLVNGHLRFRVYLKDPMQLELERIALFAVELFPGIKIDVDRVQFAPRYLVKTKIDRIQGLIERASELQDRALVKEVRRRQALEAAKERDERERDSPTDPDFPITRQRRGTTHVEFVCKKNHAAVRTTAACNGHCSRCHRLIVQGAQIIECKGCLPNAVPWWACHLCSVHCGYDPAKPLVRKPATVKDSKRAFDPGPEPVTPRLANRQRTTQPSSPKAPAPWESAPAAQPRPTTRTDPIDVIGTTGGILRRLIPFDILVHPSIEGDGDMDTHVMHYQLNNVTLLCRLMQDVCERLGIDQKHVRFVFDGNVLDARHGADEMAEDLRMSQDDIVDVVLPAWCRERPPLGLHVYEMSRQPPSSTSLTTVPSEQKDEEAPAPVVVVAPLAAKRFSWRLDQKQVLEHLYWEKNIHYPTRAQKVQYAEMLKVEFRSLDNWFVSRRSWDKNAERQVDVVVAQESFTQASDLLIEEIRVMCGVQGAFVERLFEAALRRKKEEEERRKQQAEQAEQAELDPSADDETSDKPTCVRFPAPPNVEEGDRVEWHVRGLLGPGFVFTMPPFAPGTRPKVAMSVHLPKRFDDASVPIQVVNVRINGQGSSDKPIALDDDSLSQTDNQGALEALADTL